MWVALKLKTTEIAGASTAMAIADYPFYVGGKYNFSNIRKGEVIIDFRLDCIFEVVLPFQIAFRTEPSKDVKIIFLDGQSYIDGSNHLFGMDTNAVVSLPFVAFLMEDNEINHRRKKKYNDVNCISSAKNTAPLDKCIV